MEHILVYKIDEETKKIYVYGVVDPQQFTVSGRYY